MPVELPVEKPVVVVETPIDETVERIGPLVAPAPTQLPQRHYFVISKSPRGRESVPSTPVSVPLEAGSSAPGQPVVTHTASEMSITWAPSPDARTSTFFVPPAVKPVAGADTPRRPTPRRRRRRRCRRWSPSHSDSIRRRRPITSTTSPPRLTKEDPYAIALPKPLTPAAVVEPEFLITGVAFGVERCFEVRPVDQVFGAMVIGPPSPRTCVTPQDTFPPLAPKNLAAIAGAGVINLIWDPNTECRSCRLPRVARRSAR